jgi:hypothetical protein
MCRAIQILEFHCTNTAAANPSAFPVSHQPSAFVPKTAVQSIQAQVPLSDPTLKTDQRHPCT